MRLRTLVAASGIVALRLLVPGVDAAAGAGAHPAQASVAAKKRICRHRVHGSRCIPVPRGVRPPHRNQDASAGPPFSGQPADGMGGSSPGVQGAVDWAYGRLNDQSYNGWCGKFVAHAFNVPALGYATAWQAGVAFGLRGGSAPAGTLVFFRRDQSNGYAGHVGIALPGKRMISAQSNGVHIGDLKLSYWRALYAGWSPPPAGWPGRPPTGQAPPIFPATTPAIFDDPAYEVHEIYGVQSASSRARPR